MTPIEKAQEIATAYEEAAGRLRSNADYNRNRGRPIPASTYDANADNSALAARCIRACIEAAKEENWSRVYNTDLDGPASAFDLITEYDAEGNENSGASFFQRALTGEQP